MMSDANMTIVRRRGHRMVKPVAFVAFPISYVACHSAFDICMFSDLMGNSYFLAPAECYQSIKRAKVWLTVSMICRGYVKHQGRSLPQDVDLFDSMGDNRHRLRNGMLASPHRKDDTIL